MTLGADHALQIAIELERRGRVFYESLASGCGHAEIEELARMLARDEVLHGETFKQMRAALPQELRGPALAESDLFSAAQELKKKIIPSPEDVFRTVLHADPVKALEMAINMESTVISYYSELAAGIAGLDAKIFTSLVEEEKKHLKTLKEVLNRLRAGS
jgi:rubrerythrin